MRIAANQSSYIPWKGYFDIINSVDLFVFYDDVQYTIRDWRNRNIIKTKDGLKWLSIPCGNQRNRLICNVGIADNFWQKKHWKSIVANYSKAPFFNFYKPFFEEIYLNNTWTNLSDFNQNTIKIISNEILQISTRFEDSRKYNLKGNKEYRVLDLLQKCKATEYLCGPSAKNYLKEEFLENAEIKLIWKEYNYTEYRQLHIPFEHKVSIIDLIFNEGPNAKEFLTSLNQKL